MINAIWVDRLRRLSEANARASAERLRRLTREQSIAQFEELCAEVHEHFPTAELPRHHPVGLIKYWKHQ